MIGIIKHIVKSKVSDLVFGLIALSLMVVSILIQKEKIYFKEDLVLVGNTISISLETTSKGGVFGMLVGILYFCSFLYCLGYNKEYHNTAKTRFNALYAFSAILAFLVSISANLFTMFIFYETLTLATYPLICFTKNNASVVAAKKYLLYLITPSLLLFLPSMMFIYHRCGNLNFSYDGILAGSGMKNSEIEILYLCTIYGIGKVALMPFHAWLPTAMIASAPVSGLLHAVAVVKTGIFMLTMITYDIFGVKQLNNAIEKFFGINWLTWIGIIGCITSSLIALKKHNIKEKLAYSTISHLSIMVCIIATFNNQAIYLILYYAFAHGIVKILLFYSNGIIQKATHETSIMEINGLGKIAPFGFSTFLIGVIFIVGIHGSAMYHIKHNISTYLIENDQLIVLLVILFASMTSVVYLGKIPYYAFCKNIKELYTIHKVDYKMKLAVIIIIIINFMMYFKFI